ncbi:acyltransferase family protein [Alteribacillus iranensis]|uniref:Fucose 4-O-acetylase n=1 Tax=Alteribacillus iranensis TaxID=930128 RepID=A0A1I2FJ93_9BACI|nr:acyltransferase family protein [Alteribacillus iranensis]SFF04596.1 Fucose 4-O-acetylase [Alteribacillus iranensis]
MTTTQPLSPQRDYFFDNAKILLMILVVISHAIRPLNDSQQISNALYLLLFSFHMPLFLFISGYFAKKAVASKKWVQPLQKLLIPYLVFQVIYTFYYSFISGDKLEFHLLQPHWSLWFLLTLCSFYFIIHFFKFSPYFLIPAVLIGIFIGYTQAGAWLSISRTLVFFPFFLAGYYLQRRHFQFLFHSWLKVPAGLVLVLCSIGLYVYSGDIPAELFYGSKSYEVMGFHGWEAGFFRLLAYTLTIVVSLAFLVLVPKEKLTISKYAQNTLYVYLLHGFLFRYLRETSFYSAIDSGFELLLLILGSVIFTFLLSSAIVKKMTQPLIEPLDVIKKKRMRRLSQKNEPSKAS